MKKNIFIHVGYPKTATKTLQAHYFPFLKNVQYLGKFSKSDKYKIIKIERKILLDLYHGNVEKILSYKKKFSKTFYNNIQKSSALISAEGLTMNSLRFIKDPTYNYLKLTSFYEVVDAIKTLFDNDLFNVKIILVTRRQIDLIPSLYAQSYKESYVNIKLVNTFKKYFDHIISDDSHSLTNFFDYSILVRILEKFFSKQNILILPFEQFAEDKINFLNNISKFMSTSFNRNVLESSKIENKSSVKYEKQSYCRFSFDEIYKEEIQKKNKKLKLLNYICSFLKFLFLNSMKPGDAVLSEQQKKIIFKKFKKSNEFLSKRYKLQLKKYLYF